MPPDEARAQLFGIMFEFGFEEISRAFRTASEAHAEIAARSEDLVRERFGLEPGSAIPDTEIGEDGEPSFDYWAEVGEAYFEADSTWQIVRTAFLIALFHFWERHANTWTNRSSYNSKAVMEWLAGQNITPDADALRHMELAANCAKHGAGRSANELFELRPDLFDEGDKESVFGFTPSDLTLRVNDATIQGWFGSVHAAGPKARRPWRT